MAIQCLDDPATICRRSGASARISKDLSGTLTLVDSKSPSVPHTIVQDLKTVSHSKVSKLRAHPPCDSTTAAMHWMAIFEVDQIGYGLRPRTDTHSRLSCGRFRLARRRRALPGDSAACLASPTSEATGSQPFLPVRNATTGV